MERGILKGTVGIEFSSRLKFQDKDPFRERLIIVAQEYPELALPIRALQQFLIRRSQKQEPPLRENEKVMLLAYSVWTEEPNHLVALAKASGISEDEIINFAGKAIYQLERESEELYDILDSLIQEREASDIGSIDLIEKEYLEYLNTRPAEADQEISKTKKSFTRSRKRDEAIAERDMQVKALKGQGLVEKQIAGMLGMTSGSVRAACVRLHREGLLPYANSRNPGKSESTILLEEDIKRLAGHGLTAQQIADTLHVSCSLVKGRIYLMNLENPGNQVKTKRATRSSIPLEDLGYYRLQVSRFREQGASTKIIFFEILKRHLFLCGAEREVNLSTIAKLVGITREYARQLYNDFSLNEAIPKRRLRAPKDLKKLDLQVRALRQQGLSTDQIMESLKESQTDIKRSVGRLLTSGEIKKHQR